MIEIPQRESIGNPDLLAHKQSPVQPILPSLRLSKKKLGPSNAPPPPCPASC